MEKTRLKLSKRNDVMGFYAEAIIPGCDIIHAEFMDRRRMEILMDKIESRHNDKIRMHLAIHDVESTKKRFRELGDSWRD
jgi:hypothetical protein